MLAVSHGRIQTSQLLLSSGAEVNARDEDGSTALMCAVEHNQLEAVKLLLSKPNCDPTIADAVSENCTRLTFLKISSVQTLPCSARIIEFSVVLLSFTQTKLIE